MKLAGGAVEWLPSSAGVLVFRVGSGATCVLNTSDSAVDLPAGEVLLASDPLVDGRLSPDAAVWLV